MNDQPDWYAQLVALARGKGASIGCDDEEIALLAKHHGAPLPAIYVDFLRLVGRSADSVFEGENAAVSDLEDLREGAAYCAAQSAIPWDERCFPFWGHQGYRFFFFRLGDGDDPPVYGVDDGPGGITKTHDHLSEFFAEAIVTELCRPPLRPNVTVYRHDL